MSYLFCQVRVHVPYVKVGFGGRGGCLLLFSSTSFVYLLFYFCLVSMYATCRVKILLFWDVADQFMQKSHRYNKKNSCGTLPFANLGLFITCVNFQIMAESWSRMEFNLSFNWMVIKEDLCPSFTSLLSVLTLGFKRDACV